jgi:hypothetical protein
MHAEMAAKLPDLIQDDVESLIDARAGKFAARPVLLEEICKGLSKLSPRQMRRTLLSLIDEELYHPNHHFWFGGEIPLIVLDAAFLYAERCCAAERKRNG